MKNTKKAFTLIEMLSVMALGVVLISLGFYGFTVVRDNVGASNAAQSVKTIFRDAQDKALTLSTYNADASSPYNQKWVYGYSIEYDSSAKAYILFAIINKTDETPKDKTNTEAVRNVFRYPTNKNCLLTGLAITSFADCKEEARYANLSQINSSNCDILFTSVNGKITIRGENALLAQYSCKILFKQNAKELTLTMNNIGNGDIQICNGNVQACAVSDTKINTTETIFPSQTVIINPTGGGDTFDPPFGGGGVEER